MRAARLHRRSVLGRLGHAAGAAALVAVALAALVVGGAFTLLRTRAGADWARRMALPQVNARLAGRLQIDAFTFGGDHLALAGVALRDPEGHLVARVQRLELGFSPLALLRRHLALAALRLEAPELFLVQDRRGLNLTRALAPRDGHAAAAAPARKPAPSGGGGPVIDLGQLAIRDGLVDLRRDLPDDQQHVRVAGLTVDGAGHFDGGRDALDAAVKLAGRSEAPQHAALSASADLRQAGDLLTFALALGAGHARLDAHGEFDQRRLVTGPAGVTVHGRDINLAELYPTAPWSSLAFELDAKGGGRDLASLEGTLNLSVPPGRFDGRPFGPVELTARAERGECAVSHLLAMLPGVRVSGTGAVIIADGSKLRAQLSVEASDLAQSARLLTPPLGPAPPPLGGRGRLDLTLGGTLRVPTLRVSGKFPQLALGDNRLTDLAFDARLPDLRQPEDAAEVDLRAAQARAGARLARDVRVRARVANGRLSFDLKAAGHTPLAVTVAGHWMGEAHQALALETLSIGYTEATWTLQRPVRLWFSPDRLEIKDLDLRAGRQSLRASLARTPAGLRGRLVVERLDLAALPRLLAPPELKLGGQLDVDARLDGTEARPEVDAKVSLTGGRFQDHRELGLDLDAHYAAARARGHLAARGLGTAVRATFDLPASWPLRDARAPLRLELALEETDLVSLQQALAHAAAVTATTAAPTAAPPPRVRGRVRLSATVGGTAGEPRLTVDAGARGLVVDGQRVGDLILAVAGNGDGPLSARLTLHLPSPPAAAPAVSDSQAAATPPATTAGGPNSPATPPPANATAGKSSAPAATANAAGSSNPRAAAPPVTAAAASNPPARPPIATAADSEIRLETPLSLKSLMRRLPDSEALLRTRFEVHADVDRLPLATLAELAGSPARVGGNLTLHLAAVGTALAPRGTVVLDLAGAASGKFPPTDGHLEAAFDDRQLTTKLTVSRKEQTLVAAEARVGAGTRDLRAPARLAAAPVHLHAVVGPLALQRLGIPLTDRQPPRELKGNVRAEVEIEGSLESPRLKAQIGVRDVRLDRSLLGVGDVDLDYRDRKAKLDARLTSANRGSLRLLASASADLGYPAVTKGLEPSQLPLTVHLAAEGFDLQGLSGATADLREVGGLLFAAADVSGTIADPRVSGKVEIKQGALTVTGFGAYKDVHLALHAAGNDLTLDELSARSGVGSARVTATAAHQSGSGYHFDSHAALDKFPIYSDGQALASVSVDAGAKGVAAPLDVNAEVSVRAARVALSDKKRKDLQSLERPSDVVLTRAGKPLNRAQQHKMDALVAAQKRAGAPDRSQATAAPPPPPPINRTRITVSAPRNIWVTGKDVYLELGILPGFHVDATDETRIFGQVVVRRGRIDILGRRFDVKSDSTLQFDGPSDKPELDVSAQFTDRADNIVVVLTAKGPIDHLTVAVSAPDHPELGESQLYTLIITGHLPTAGGSSGSISATGEAGSLLGGLVASQLQKTLARRLPLDVLTIDAGDNGVSGTQLEAGKYVTDKLYFGYVGRVGADPTRYQNRNAVHLEYQLTARWSFSGEYGDVGTGSGDLIWTKHY
jgi:translocation and assembly module TamB